jgi:heptaprenyl diphosphate synthase
MTRSSASPAARDPRRTAALVAAACVLQVAESLIPHPVPGVRLGLANIITLVTLAEGGLGAAMEVALLRTVVASLALGSFLTPGFILSFCSAAASTLVMWALWRFSSRFSSAGFGLPGISVAGAAAHALAQLLLAYVLLVRHPGVFYFAPWLAVSAVITGWLNAMVAAEVIRSAPGALAGLPETAPVLPAAAAAPAGSWLRRLSPAVKISGAAAILLLAVAASSLRGLLPAALALLAAAAAARPDGAERARLLAGLKRVSWLALASFLLPLFFSAASGGNHAEAMLAGSLFAARLLLMGCTGFLLNVCASPEDIARGIAALGRPFGRLGFSADRAGTVIGLAWASLPAFTERARAAARAAMAGRGWRSRPVGWSVELAAGVINGMCGASHAA